LFLEEHRDGMRELLIEADLRMTADSTSRDSKSLRQTGISMRLELGPNIDYRDIAKWARTSPGMIGKFYDQTHPKESVQRVTGFRPAKKRVPKNAKERQRIRQAKRNLAKLRVAVRAEQAVLAKWERDEQEPEDPIHGPHATSGDDPVSVTDIASAK